MRHNFLTFKVSAILRELALQEQGYRGHAINYFLLS
jgi:hypothetical protein